MEWLVPSHRLNIRSTKMAALEGRGRYALSWNMPEPARTYICALDVSMATSWALVQRICFPKQAPELMTDVRLLRQKTYFKVLVCEFLEQEFRF